MSADSFVGPGLDILLVSTSSMQFTQLLVILYLLCVAAQLCPVDDEFTGKMFA